MPKSGMMPWILIFVCAAAAFVRLTVRDASGTTAAVYYAFPIIVIAALMFTAGMAWLRRRRRVCGISAAACGLALAGLWFQESYIHRDPYPAGRGEACLAPVGFTEGELHREPNPAKGKIRIMLWNVCRQTELWRQKIEAIRAADADVVGLVEARKGEGEEAFWKANFPDYDVWCAGGGLVLLTRGKLERKGYYPLARRNRYAEVEIAVEGKKLRWFLVDIEPNPLNSRREPIEELLRAALPGDRTPTIIMGDFNTPIDSVWFRPLRRNFRHAFETAGRGLLATWPAPVPFIALDHIWVSPELRIERAEIPWSFYSDHLPVVTEVSWNE